MPQLVLRRLVLPVAVAAALGAAPAYGACGSSGYTYAGVQSAAAGFGVGATVSMVGVPHVRSGHVAAWVGVAPDGGADRWLQVGFSAFAGSGAGTLYYEVATPGNPPRYVEVESGLLVGASRRVEVLELSHSPGVWRVRVDGHAVSPPIPLPGSHGSWRPVATVESWGGGQSVCNGFAYRFDRIALARAPGGAWAPFASGSAIGSGYRVDRISPASFVARSEPLARTVLAAASR